ncbi:MAG: LysE family translocator [Verrucomicrobia bacterium]|nr:LysE family translocator [Verrucomicrobiota bacterium]
MIELLGFALINLLGAMSPGPDFAIVVRYGLTGSRRAAILATAGISVAILIHVFYCVAGIVFLIQKYEALFSLLQFGGAAYLAYLGLKLIKAGMGKAGKMDPAKIHHRAFRDGFVTNLLNPKVTLFLLSLFAQFVTPETSFGQRIAFGATIPIVTFGWFSFLSCMLTHQRFVPHLQRYQQIFMTVMGAVLLALAGWVIFNAC